MVGQNHATDVDGVVKNGPDSVVIGSERGLVKKWMGGGRCVVQWRSMVCERMTESELYS